MSSNFLGSRASALLLWKTNVIAANDPHPSFLLAFAAEHMSNGQPGSAALAMAPPKTLSSPRVVDGRKHWTDSSDAGALLSSSQNTGFFINTFSALSAQHSTALSGLLWGSELHLSQTQCTLVSSSS